MSTTAGAALSCVSDALHHLGLLPPITRKEHFNRFRMRCDLKMGLRNLKALLLLSENDDDPCQGSLGSLFSKIQEVAGIVDREIEVECDLYFNVIDEVQYFNVNGRFQSHSLTVDEAVGIADSVLDNTIDFLRLANLEIVLSAYVYENLDALEVRIRFLRSFLLYAVGTGVEQKQLHNFLAQIQPYAINAARVFIKDYPDKAFARGIFVDVESKSLKLHFSYPYLYDQAYLEALCTSRLYRPTRYMDDDGILRNFLDSLISLLWNRWWFSSYLFEPRYNRLRVSLYGRLRSCRAILKLSSRNLDAEIRNQIGVLVCDAGILFFTFRPTDADMLDLLKRFDAILAEVEISTSEFNFPWANDQLQFADTTSVNISGGVVELKEIGMSSCHHRSSTAEAVGFQDDEITSMRNGLLRGSNHLRIVAIVGMAGLGKTTLALKLFNDPSVARHFLVRAWFSVSQFLDKRRVFLQLLNQLRPGDYSEDSEDDLANKLRQSLKGKRYLIFLDDVWTSEAWDSLEASFPDDSTQSRIILTTRQSCIARAGLLVNGEPYSLRLRKNEECLEILEAKLFTGMGWPRELEDIGMKIAGKCKGLPLTTVIIAGLLATMEQESWIEILNALSKGSLSSSEQCNSALELSYCHLPEELKACLLYFGAFPEDHIVSVKRLIRLWMAEEFFRADEDVARAYLDQLIERSLVMVAQNRSIGGVKTCRVHDLLHDFCRFKAKQEWFFDLLQGYDQLSAFNDSYYQQRLCIHSDPLHLKKSGLVCHRAHSLLFFSTQRLEWYDYCFFDMSCIIKMAKLLKVVAIEQLPLTFDLPSEIELLSKLKFFLFQSNIPVIPPSIGKLSELETFIADFRTFSGEISFPNTLWDLKKLKYLHVHCFGGFILPSENSSTLSVLETLRGIVFYSDGSMKEQMNKFPNIRRLKCRIKRTFQTPGEYDTEIVVPEFLRQLQSLTICGSGKLKCEFGSVTNLTKVKLEGFLLSRKEIEAIGNIPNLKVLKLLEISFSGDILEMEEGEFSELEFLEIVGSYGLKGWIATDEQLPNLQKLVMELCFKLKEIPSCLEAIPTLEEIQVYHCSSTLKTLVEHIEQQHKDYGDSIKVIVHEYDPSQA